MNIKRTEGSALLSQKTAATDMSLHMHHTLWLLLRLNRTLSSVRLPATAYSSLVCVLNASRRTHGSRGARSFLTITSPLTNQAFNTAPLPICQGLCLVAALDVISA